MKNNLTYTLAAMTLCIMSSDAFAEKPSINTDSSIVHGLSGRPVRTFGKLVSATKLLRNGEEIANPNNECTKK